MMRNYEGTHPDKIYYWLACCGTNGRKKEEMFPLQMSVVCLTTLAFSPSKYKSLLRLVLVLVVKNKFISLLYNGSMEVSSNTKDFKRNASHVLCSLMHFSSLTLSVVSKGFLPLEPFQFDGDWRD